jgi:hypothetical protein
MPSYGLHLVLNIFLFLVSTAKLIGHSGTLGEARQKGATPLMLRQYYWSYHSFFAYRESMENKKDKKYPYGRCEFALLCLQAQGAKLRQ